MTRPNINDINTESGLVGLGPIPGLAPVASFNADQIESLLKTKGFVCMHYKHAPSVDEETLNSPTNPNTQAANRGFVYYSVRSLLAIPQQFKLEDRLTVQGIYGVGSVMVNVTGYYTDGNKAQAHIRNRDLLVFPTLTTMVDQKAEYNPNGPMKLQYRAKGIDYLADKKRVYSEGQDFKLEDGKIVWLDDGFKPEFINGKGAILSVVYYATPIYIVQSLPHSLRVVPSNHIGHGAFPREANYLPQLIVAKPSTLMEEANILDWTEIPPYPEYRDSNNTTGGSW